MNKRKLVLTSGVANTFEWYDYALFGHFVPIIGQKFFPENDPSAALLQVFLVFAVGYLMRPIGGIFFGIIGDKLGRKTSLSLAIMCMAVPTAAIGLLPTYETLGITSTVAMIVFRMLQGLSMGGALTGSISYIIEHTEKNKRGLYGSIPMLSICLGILFGSLVSFCVKNIFSAEQFNLWAWRLPFIIGILVFFVGIYIKNNTKETPLFEETKYRGEVVKSPLSTLVRKHWRDILISILINAAGSIIFYIEAIYLVSYLKISRNFPESNVEILVNFCYVIMIFVTLFAGWLSDKIGRRKIFLLNLVFIIVATPFIFRIFESASFGYVIIAQIVIAIMAALYIGPEPALQAEFYPTEIRNTALSVSYNIATSVFGGTAPYIIESLVQNTGGITASVYYIIAAAFGSLFALYFYKDRSLDDHKVHIDPEN
ncbi:MAG: MFS transporter [Rickettsiaceae bacterium]|nr:MFS transporter [Rickettsiaceae bacterium]